MKKFFALVVVGALIAGGFYGYKRHERATLLEAISPLVKNASIRVANSSKLVTGDTSITYKEMFDRLDTDTAEIEKRSIDIESMSTKETADLTDPAVAYMRDCQEFSRALSMKYRKQLAFNNSIEAVKEARAELRTSNSDGFEYVKKRGDRAIEQMGKAAEEAKSAIIDFAKAATKLKESRSKLATVLSEDTLVPLSQLEPLALTKEDEAKIGGSKPKPKT